MGLPWHVCRTGSGARVCKVRDLPAVLLGIIEGHGRRHAVLGLDQVGIVGRAGGSCILGRASCLFRSQELTMGVHGEHPFGKQLLCVPSTDFSCLLRFFAGFGIGAHHDDDVALEGTPVQMAVLLP